MPILRCLFACLLVAALAAAEEGKPAMDHRVADFLGPAAVRVIGQATRVEAFRIDPMPQRAIQEASQMIDGYHIVSAAGEQKDAAPILRALLSDAATYDFESAKLCEFMPGVAFRLWSGAEHVDLLVCLSCNEVRVLTYDAAGAIAKRSHEDCDHARPQLLGLAKAAFPKDEEVQALK